MITDIDSSWREALKDILLSDSFKQMSSSIKGEYLTKCIYPEEKNIFKALNLTPLADVQVVIIGQDPYHGEQDGLPQAQGLSFSVPKNVKNPPSLQNIFKEIRLEFGKESQAESSFGGDLTCWAEQGVLLLNAVLTVEAGKAGSHANRGWEVLTDEIISTISEKRDDVAFLLWGAYARKKRGLINENKHLILESVHPSPLSAHGGFFGCGHFKKANEWLKVRGKEEVHW